MGAAGWTGMEEYNILCCVFDIELAILQTYVFHMINKVQNISGNLKAACLFRICAPRIWERGFCCLFAFRQLYAESSSKYSRGSEFSNSHWKESFLLPALIYLDFNKETLLDEQELSLFAVEMPEK